MTEETTIPTWRLREELRRTAERTIEGRANFERHMGRKSTKPLTPITLTPHEVLQLLDDSLRVHDAWNAGAEAGFDALEIETVEQVWARNPWA